MTDLIIRISVDELKDRNPEHLAVELNGSPVSLYRPDTIDSRIWDFLTEREREVIILISAGLTNPEIAERLCIAPATVKQHVWRIASTVGRGNKSRIGAMALISGYVTPEEVLAVWRSYSDPYLSEADGDN